MPSLPQKYAWWPIINNILRKRIDSLVCGRFNIVTDPSAWMDALDVIRLNLHPDSFEPRYNISPSEPPLRPGSKRSTPPRLTRVPIVFQKSGELVAEQAIWPLIPPWANGVVTKYSTANARSEDIADKNAYRRAWRQSQRCLIYATGFFEWQSRPGQKAKQPWNIRLHRENDFAFGGLWESGRTAGGAEFLSCTIITLPANELMRNIHNSGRNKHRMPLLLPRTAHQPWLDAPLDSTQDFIKALPSTSLEAWPISAAVNNPNFDDPSVLHPISLPGANQY